MCLRQDQNNYYVFVLCLWQRLSGILSYTEKKFTCDSGIPEEDFAVTVDMNPGLLKVSFVDVFEVIMAFVVTFVADISMLMFDAFFVTGLKAKLADVEASVRDFVVTFIWLLESDAEN